MIHYVRNKNKFIVTLLILTVLFSSTVNALTVDKGNHISIDIVVREGDTLWCIANKYYPETTNIRKTIYDIKKHNNISHYIYPGQVLTLTITTEDFNQINSEIAQK